MAKKILKIFLFSVVLIMVFSFAYDASAQTINQSLSPANNTTGNTSGWNFLKDVAGFATDLAAGVTAKISLVDEATDGILTIFVHIQRWLTGISAGIFNMVFTFSMQAYPTLIRTNQIINQPWILIRDLINISLIFILLYISINTILGRNSAYTKKNIPSIIISAVMINFSMFISKVVIDLGNRVAVSIYNIITGSGQTQLGSRILSSLELSNFVSTSFWGDFLLTGQLLNKSFMVLEIVLQAIVFWTFLYVAFLFIGRCIVLTMLMVTSPVGFLGGIIPSLSSKTSEWWSKLIDQTIVAPFFLIFLYILIKMLDKAQEIKNTISTLSKAQNSNIDIGLFFFFAIIIGTLIAGVKYTKKLSGEVGSLAEKIAGAISTALLAIITGGVAAAGRYTLGKAAATALSAGRGARNARIARGGIGAFIARQEGNALRAVSKSSFNLRNTGLGSKFEKGTGINLGFGKKPKGGYADIMEAREKAAKKEASEIGPAKAIEDLKRLEKLSRDIKDEIKGRVRATTGTTIEDAQKAHDKAQEELGSASKILEDAKKSGTVATPDQIQAEADARRKLTEATDKLAKVTQKQNDITRDVFKENGTSESEIVNEMEKQRTKIDEAVATRNQYAQSVEQGRTLESMFMPQENRKKLAKQIRTQSEKFKDKDLKKQFKELFEEVEGKKEEGGGDKK